MRKGSILTLLAVVIAAGCGSKDPAASSTGTTVTPATPPTTATSTSAAPTTTTTQGFTVPSVIDVAYAQKVLSTIYHLDGEATRHAYALKRVDQETLDRLDAIFGLNTLEVAKRLLRESAGVSFRNFADPPQDATVRVVEVVQATPTCIVVEADLDFAPYFKEAVPNGPPVVIQLAPADLLPFNPTAWGVVAAGEAASGTKLEVC